MYIIGELINASRKAIGAAIEALDAEAIQKVAKDQAEAGASYIDVNAPSSWERSPSTSNGWWRPSRPSPTYHAPSTVPTSR